MTNPWDPPPLPNTADTVNDPLFISIGQILSAWEYVEFKLARMSSIFAGAEDAWEAVQKYGDGLTYSKRVAAFTQLSTAFFTTSPCQELEGSLAALLIECEGYSKIRNDIAHGVVFNCAVMPDLKAAFGLPDSPAEQYLLIPPAQTLKKYVGGGVVRPTYAYNSAMINDRFLYLFILQERLEVLRHRLSEHAIKAQARRQPSGSRP